MKTIMVAYHHGYRIPIYPTDTQAKFIDRCIELSRYVYNWTIDRQEEHYKLYKEGKTDRAFLGKYTVAAMFAKHRRENKWLQDIPDHTARNAIFHCITAFERFFNPKHTKHKYPKYKSKKRSKQSFETDGDRFYFENNMLRIQGLPRGELIRTNYYTKFKKSDNINYGNTVISKDNLGQYWVSFSIPKTKLVEDYSDVAFRHKAIGIDLNVKNRMVLSTGEIFKAPDTKRLEKRIQRQQSLVSKDKERHEKMVEEKRKRNVDGLFFIDKHGQRITNSAYDSIPMSKRAQKRAAKLSKYCKRLTNINNSFHHETTAHIIKKYRDTECIVMEDIDKTDMDSDRWISKHTHTVPFYGIRRMMEYKCKRNNIQFMVADREYPSSQLCSNCGNRRKIGSAKTYKCPVCGLKIHRDINAAINLSNYYYNSRA